MIRGARRGRPFSPPREATERRRGTFDLHKPSNQEQSVSWQVFRRRNMFRTAMIATVLVLAGCAATPKPAETASTAAKPPCPTASRLPQSNCVAGSSYSQKELDSTGQQNNNLGTSLKM